MGHRQGVRKLQSGFSRRLTPHELDRGYVFVSKDKHLVEVLEIKGFEVELNGETFPNRRLDVSGRFSVPRRVLQAIGASHDLRFTLASRRKLIMQQEHLHT